MCAAGVAGARAAVAVVLTTSESKSLGPSLLQGGRLHHVLPLATPTVRSRPSVMEALSNVLVCRGRPRRSFCAVWALIWGCCSN